MDQPIPVNTDNNILGIIIDISWTFLQHTHDIHVCTRAKSRLNVIKALSSTAFGHLKDSLAALHKQFVSCIVSYAIPA